LDARTFDVLVRAFSRSGSRRRLVGGILGLGAGGFAARATGVRADSDVGSGADSESVGGSDGTGGSDGATATTTPVPGESGTTGAGAAVAAPVSTARPPFPALISTGTCENLDPVETYDLFDVVPGGTTDDEEAETVGAATGIPVSQSVTTVRVSLGDLLTTPHAIVLQAGEDDDTPIVCGDIGGLRVGDDLAIGLRDISSSGYGGIAWLRGQNGSTLTYVFVAPSLGGAATVAAGSTVVTVADVNLRTEPTTDAGVVTVLPSGTQLEVTGEAEGDWLPVEVSETGETGYVAAQYLAVVE
jgi:hypothetical protein